MRISLSLKTKIKCIKFEIIIQIEKNSLLILKVKVRPKFLVVHGPSFSHREEITLKFNFMHKFRDTRNRYQLFLDAFYDVNYTGIKSGTVCMYK